MANSTATMKITMTYTSPQGAAAAPPPISIPCPYQAQLDGAIDVPDGTCSGTELEIPFGSIAAATLVLVKNSLAQELGIKVNGKPISASGTLVAGEKVVEVETHSGDHLSVVAGADNGGSPGHLHVRRLGGDCVKVESYTSDGIEDEDIGDFTVFVNGGPVTHRIPPGGVWTSAGPAAVCHAQLASLTLVTTAHQEGAGRVAFLAFGDPT